jgi:hypothetical protein
MGLSAVDVMVGTAGGTVVSVGGMGVEAGVQEIKTSAAKVVITIILMVTSGSRSVIDHGNSTYTNGGRPPAAKRAELVGTVMDEHTLEVQNHKATPE